MSARIPQGLHVEDRLALGLSAPHLGYLVVACVCGYSVLGSGLPGLVRVPLALMMFGCGVTLAWGRAARRGIDEWALLYVAFLLRPRRSQVSDPRPVRVLLRAPHHRDTLA